MYVIFLGKRNDKNRRGNGFMRDARNRNRHVFGAAGGSISFGAKVNLAFRGKLGDMEVEKQGDSSESDSVPSVHVPGGALVECMTTNKNELDEG
jgi:hypothetical protein